MSSVLVCDGQLSVDVTGSPACKYSDGSNAWQAAPTDSIFVAKLFEVPDVSQLQMAFMASFSVVMITHLASWAYGKVIHFAESKHKD